MLVSVIVPTHNRPELLADALASVRAQTFTDYEVIVVSNGESPENRDRSQAIAAIAGASWFALPLGNLPAARNFGIDRARGEWIAFLDDDDLWLPEKLEMQLAASRETAADLIACDLLRFYPDRPETVQSIRRPAGWTYSRALNYHYWFALPSTVMVRREVLQKLGGFNERLHAREDTDMWRRLAWQHAIHQMDDVLVRYRCGHSAITSNLRRNLRYDLLHLILMYCDTPKALRHELPPFIMRAARRLIGGFLMPNQLTAKNWLVGWLHRSAPSS